uniref:glucan endo-1,3-beta-D-glucosidase n=1 Tax=Populus trichocarpa TaxID=3694 RepID=A0A3N7F8R2_POPTR
MLSLILGFKSWWVFPMICFIIWPIVSKLLTPGWPRMSLLISLLVVQTSVGNEPFLSSYNGSFLGTTLPALRNIQSALTKAGLSTRVKVTVPLNADVYESPTNLPSDGDFRSDIHDLMLSIVKFLSDNGAPFTVNIYPFISLCSDPNSPLGFAFFGNKSFPLNDGGTIYDNVFDANHDTLIRALQKNGYGSLPVVIGEIGWPTNEHKTRPVVTSVFA